ncbi:MAG: o-succinylbenzoate synthase, partial [Muribaculaceae bacterium]|nr:o-succinylbenzoate synthase [Muribaculaceae bacterium]
IWMGDKHTMKQRIDEKLDAGFRVLKLKIGGINFGDEVDLLRYIRSVYPSDVLELRLDANGSFTCDNAMKRLEELSAFGIHSIEQPIKAGHTSQMAAICNASPIPIALDEELIGTRSREESRQMLVEIKPSYIILKPALCGGFLGADTWIEEACRLGIGYWFTSALESNIGLEAIALHVAQNSCDVPQGLGTGQLFVNNFDSPLFLKGERMYYDASKKLTIPDLRWRQ